VRFWRKIHRWLGLVVALQILLWISGGVVMSVIPIDMVRGQHLLKTQTPMQSLALNVSEATIQLDQWQSLEWQSRMGQRVLRARDFNGHVHYLDGHFFAPLAPLTERDIAAIAKERSANPTEIDSILLLEQLPLEANHLEPPVYQVNFADSIHTAFYLQPLSGEVLAVRSDIWRFYDFFWMLHIMDYAQRESFNHPLLISFALAALAFVFSGFLLLYFSMLKPQFKKWRFRHQQTRDEL
jgi:uncharacterized iron-regulated membrane protein